MSQGAYPNGLAWRCSSCDFECDDNGPDYCPNDGAPLTRVMLAFRSQSPRIPLDDPADHEKKRFGF